MTRPAVSPPPPRRRSCRAPPPPPPRVAQAALRLASRRRARPCGGAASRPSALPAGHGRAFDACAYVTQLHGVAAAVPSRGVFAQPRLRVLPQPHQQVSPRLTAPCAPSNTMPACRGSGLLTGAHAV